MVLNKNNVLFLNQNNVLLVNTSNVLFLNKNDVVLLKKNNAWLLKKNDVLPPSPNKQKSLVLNKNNILGYPGDGQWGPESWIGSLVHDPGPGS